MALPDRKRNRMMGYNYSKEGLYFVTSCVHEQACVFGVVMDGEMQLNAYGRIAEKQWHWLSEQYPYTYVHAFVVMPNHVHAIIEIEQAFVGTGRDLSAHTAKLSPHSTSPSAHFPGDSYTTNQSAQERLSMHDLDRSGNDSNRSRPVPTRVKSISELMGAYKTTTSKMIRLAGLQDFAWQRSFHDHIIRHEKAYQQIEQYIHNNPALWDNDVFYQ
ncbi:transposase [uncultured Pontibacter sp.]|uniref:transposase n=1 Tax=uncultured Pontibacter sp. TaxID=453356 RepID=UPI00261E51E0|nr:transposase [uncultured Pontibacter sp.]